MNNDDYLFKLLIATVLAGLVAACLPSDQATPDHQPAAAEISATSVPQK